MLEILKTDPVFKNVIWGGDHLRYFLNKTAQGSDVGESWEISCHKDGLSRVDGGQHAGKTLKEVIKGAGDHVLGTKYIEAGYTDFPLLIKFIDANDALSVQVHPDDTFAKVHEKEPGKTEMWYVVWAKPGAQLVCGFSSDVEENEFEALARSGKIAEKLNYVPVSAGDAFFIEAGKVHAIGEGILIYEIQQNSNSTYRLYDWGRVDKDGNARRLDIEKAAMVSKLDREDKAVKTVGETHMEGTTEVTLLKQCSHFSLYKIEAADQYKRLADKESFEALSFLSGKGTITAKSLALEFCAGDSFFVPAGFGEYEIRGKCSLLIGRL